MRFLRCSSCRVIVLTVLALTILLPLLCSAEARTEYVCLTADGRSMNPTIRDGDQVKVKICVDGDQIETGDIIIYCSIVTHRLDLSCMWIGHRVTKKYWKDGIWHFRTRGDNNPEPDPWSVPEHALLGIVVEINHTDSSQESVATSSSDALLPLEIPITPWNILIAFTSVVGIIILLAEDDRLDLRNNHNLHHYYTFRWMPNNGEAINLSKDPYYNIVTRH
jgi:signal peptidase I